MKHLTIKKIPKALPYITITFAIGGAGAQTDHAIAVLKSLKPLIVDGKIRINLVAGTRMEVHDLFMEQINALHLEKKLGDGIKLVRALEKKTYFEQFNKALRQTDILWTKPSELVFYAGLGIPLIFTPPVGYHEQLNEKWLTQIGAAFPQEDPQYASEWLMDWIKDGRLAEAAWQGYMEVKNDGTYEIEKLIFRK